MDTQRSPLNYGPSLMETSVVDLDLKYNHNYYVSLN